MDRQVRCSVTRPAACVEHTPVKTVWLNECIALDVVGITTEECFVFEGNSLGHWPSPLAVYWFWKWYRGCLKRVSMRSLKRVRRSAISGHACGRCRHSLLPALATPTVHGSRRPRSLPGVEVDVIGSSLPRHGR